MNKKVLLTSILGFSIANASPFVDVSQLSGDTRSACEALLCLASPVKPPECAPAITKYFSIKFKKPWKTLDARKSFLNLCPLGDGGAIVSGDKDLENWRNSIVNLTGTCFLSDLNNKYQRTILEMKEVCTGGGHETPPSCRKVPVYGYRISTELDNNCKILSSSKYSNYKLKYVCSTKFYPEEDWNNGYEKKEVSLENYNSLKPEDRLSGEKYTEVSYSEFKSLPRDKRKMVIGQGIKYYRIDIAYYQKMYINKNCWINQES